MKNLFGNVQDIFNNKEVSEIIIDGYDDVYWEESGKIKESADLFSNEDEVREVMKNLLGSVDRKIENVEDGFADLRLADGTRVAITLPPISLNGPTMVIRKLHEHKVTPENLVEWKAINNEGWEICEKLMQKGKNVIIAGNAGSGKTTLTNLIIGAINKAWRVVTVEKTAELDTNGRKRTLRLETPTAKSSEMGPLLEKAGMLRGDTVVINELMGSETFQALNLMREGYSVVATIASEGVSDALKKAEIFCLMGQYGLGINEIKYHVTSAVDAVIFQERLDSGRRVVTNIALVDGVDDKGNYITKPLFSYDEDSDAFTTTAAGKSFLK